MCTYLAQVEHFRLSIIMGEIIHSVGLEMMLADNNMIDTTPPHVFHVLMFFTCYINTKCMVVGTISKWRTHASSTSSFIVSINNRNLLIISLQMVPTVVWRGVWRVCAWTQCALQLPGTSPDAEVIIILIFLCLAGLQVPLMQALSIDRSLCPLTPE